MLSLPRRSLLDDGELFPPPDKTELFLEKYLQSVSEDASSKVQEDEFVPPPEQIELFLDKCLQLVTKDPSSQSEVEEGFEVSPFWNEILRAGGLQEKRKEWPEGLLENSSPEPEDEEVLNWMMDQEENLTEREEEGTNQTADIAREILEEVLEKCQERSQLQITVVRPVLDGIIAAALRTHHPGSDEDDGTLDSSVETSQEEIFSSSLSPNNTVAAKRTPIIVMKQQLPLSQQDMFASQTSSEDEEPAVVSASGDDRTTITITTTTASGDQIRKTPGKMLPLVPYSPSSGESSSEEEEESVLEDVRTQPAEDLGDYQNDLFCLKARMMNIKVERLSGSNESFLTVSSGESGSQASSVSSLEEIKSPIQIPVENCRSPEKEKKEREESSQAEPVRVEEPLKVDVPRRICQRFKFLPDQEEGFEEARAREDLAYKPVTSFVLRKRKKKMKKRSSASGKVKPKDIPQKYILIQNWLIENEDFVVQLEKSKELIIHGMPDQTTVAHILVGPMTGIFLLSADNLAKVSIRDTYRECSRSLRELWLLCIGSYDVYMRSTGLSYELSRREEQSACRVFPLLLNDNIESIASWVIQLSRRQRREEIRPHLQDGSTRHEVMLVRMFPCLNSLSAKLILSKMKLLAFLKLSSVEELSGHFPWLSQSAVKMILYVRSVRLTSGGSGGAQRSRARPGRR